MDILAGIESKARAMAQHAKDCVAKIGGETYILHFDPKEWVYRVSLNGELLVSFNTKRLSTAKRYLAEWIG